MNNIKTISDFVNKIIRKNILFIFTIIIINYHFIQRWTHISTRGVSFNDYLSLSVYTLITISVLTMLNVNFYMRKSYDTIKILCKNDFDYFLGVSLAVIRNNIIFCLIPVIYAIAYSFLVRPLSIVTIKTTLFILVFEWFLPLSILSIVISFFSIIIENLILKVILSSLFLYITSTKMLDKLINIKDDFFKAVLKSLNIFEDQSYAYYSDFLGKVSNSAYIIDKTIPLLFAISLIVIAYFILNNISRKYINSSIVVSVYIILFIGLNYISSGMSTYRDDDTNYNNYINKSNISDTNIKSHNINIDLKSKSNIKDTITLVNTSKKELSHINLILDEIFKIKSVKVNSENLEFSMESDLVTINLNKNLKPNEKILVDIEYEGYINIFTSWNENKYVATKSDIMLPPNSICWYPKVNQSNDIEFTVNLSSKSNVYSNLTLVNKDDGFISKDYVFKGKSNDIALYAGEFSEKVENDIKIIYPSDVDVDLVIKSKFDFLTETMNEILNNKNAPLATKKYTDEVKNIINSIKNKKINTILVASLPDNKFTYVDKNKERFNIDIYHFLSENTLIIDK